MTNQHGADAATKRAAPAAGSMDLVVSTEWLAQHLADADLVVLDCTVLFATTPEGEMRRVSGSAAYAEGHLPGAGFADLIDDLSDTASPLSFAVPAAEALCAAFGRLGIGDDSRVVLYDSTIAAWAARVWWMLRAVGFDQAAVLDGGLRAWVAEGRELSTAAYEPQVRVLTPRKRPRLIADLQEVKAAVSDDAVLLVDTLSAGHFDGSSPMYSRPGHIPGAVNASAIDLIDDTGRFRPLEELAAMHPFDPEQRTITYCGGGIAASSSALTLTRLGFTDVAVYTASLQEWAADPRNPLTTDVG